jgi:phosphoglycerate dehydrogenase-like enzyme
VIPYTGLPQTTRELLLERPSLPVYNLHHNAEPTAELALTLLLAAAKRIVPIDRRFRGGSAEDRGDRNQALRLAGRRALVLGHGAIGGRIARGCRGLGLEVQVLARRARREGQLRVHGADELASLLPKSDVLLIALPGTPETEGLLGEAELAALPPDAILVNVARGAIVDEAALYEALRSQRLFGAGLDVWWQPVGAKHPFPAQHPFADLDNVVLSPHRAGHVRDDNAARATHLIALLGALAAGREPESRVDVAAGY